MVLKLASGGPHRHPRRAPAHIETATAAPTGGSGLPPGQRRACAHLLLRGKGTPLHGADNPTPSPPRSPSRAEPRDGPGLAGRPQGCVCRLTRAGHVVHAGGGEQLHGLVSARKSIWRQRKHLAQKPLTSPRGHSHSESARSDLQTVKPQFLYFKKRWFNSATGYFYLMKQKTQGPWENYENGPHGRHRPRPQGAWPGCPGSRLWSDAMSLLCPRELALRQRPQCYITAS